ncbi:unnamed protein product [Eruca vesicaria subsp. sativa]|uniref:Uncharacterized protein n=1 Tax=Eruca vesicaria subsp. sativa TaxID=29727 RepID=A0ABC8JBG2_ERUVS|nr:unnamed protein product [Eruca vesicaria subsp. sativa]
MLANEKEQSSNHVNEEVDLDELMDVVYFLLFEIYATICNVSVLTAEKREAFNRQGHGEYREVSEGDFLGEVTRSESDLSFLPQGVFTAAKCSFLCHEASNQDLAFKGIAIDRLVGFQDLGTKDDFSTTKLKNVLSFNKNA